MSPEPGSDHVVICKHVQSDALAVDYGHSRSGTERKISYPWGGARISTYLERGIGNIMI